MAEIKVEMLQHRAAVEACGGLRRRKAEGGGWWVAKTFIRKKLGHTMVWQKHL